MFETDVALAGMTLTRDRKYGGISNIPSLSGAGYCEPYIESLAIVSERGWDRGEYSVPTNLLLQPYVSTQWTPEKDYHLERYAENIAEVENVTGAE